MRALIIEKLISTRDHSTGAAKLMPILPPRTQHTLPATSPRPASRMLIVSPMCGIKEKMTIAPELETFAT